MGFFRGGFVLILGILLFFSFLLMNSFFILQSSLKYENVKAGLDPLVKNLSMPGTGELIPKEVVGEFNLTDAANDALRTAKSYCRNKNNAYYFFDYQGYSVNISCETVLNSSSPDAVINETYNDVIYDIYYKEYDCKFWDCFSKTKLPFFLVSEKAMNYWKSKFYLSLLVSLALVTLIFLFVEQKVNTPIIVGFLLAVSTLPLLKLKDFIYALAGDFSVLINIFLSTTREVFFFSLILGMLLIGAGVGLKSWKPGPAKKDLSKKDVEEIVKKEIIQQKTHPKKQKNKKK